MEEQLEKYRDESIALCSRLIANLNQNQADAAAFFGRDMYRAYLSATEAAIDKAQQCRYKIRNL